MIVKNHFHKKGFALGLVLKQRLPVSRKWPITVQVVDKQRPLLDMHDKCHSAFTSEEVE